jgi:hypothetical protein
VPALRRSRSTQFSEHLSPLAPGTPTSPESVQPSGAQPQETLEPVLVQLQLCSPSPLRITIVVDQAALLSLGLSRRI